MHTSAVAVQGLRRRRRTGRRPADQRGREETGLDRAGVPTDSRDEGAAGELAHLGAVSVDCCDRQAGQPGVRRVVVTDDRQISGHRKTELIRRVQDSDRGEVVRRKDRGRAVR